MSSEEAQLQPHVVIFPLPVQGHTNCMLNLAHLLCLSQIEITFIVSEFSHRRLLKHTTVQSTFAQYPGRFRFRPISDGLPDDHPRAGQKITDILTSVGDIMVPLFKDFFASAQLSHSPITCIIADGSLNFAADFAEEQAVPLVYFRTATVSYFWSLFNVTQLVEAHEIPFKGDSMDELVKSVPGTEGFLRRRDLPGFCRVEDTNDPLLQALTTASKQIVRAQAAIFNTFEDLEGSLVSEAQKQIPIKIYSIGPLHSHLKSRLKENNASSSILSGSFWAEDRSCIDWLNQQPPKSVIYVSFGSITVVTREQLLEFWHGLVNSSQRFLWVVRPDSVTGKDGENEIPAGLKEGTKERGYLVEWVPQEEVLNHTSVGGFLTHSGWNSTLESIAAGVPMICWPYFADQTINSRFVSEVWKIGLDIKDSCDRLIIESAIREVMEVRKDEFLGRAEHMANLVEKAVSKGGSSYCDMDALTEYIKSSGNVSRNKLTSLMKPN